MKTIIIFILLCLFLSFTFVHCEKKEEKEEIKIEKTKETAEVKETTQAKETEELKPTDDESNYTAPNPSGETIFFDHFNEDPLREGGKWKASTNEKFKGVWKWGNPLTLPGFQSDKGLLTTTEANFYAISTKFDNPIDNTDKNLVVQYEVKFEESSGMGCGGAYIKLVKDEKDFDPVTFADNTPYVIMFGPDKCGTTNKVHFIFRHFNPKSNTWEEKHLENAPGIKNDNLSHLYTLVVNKDNTYEILVDSKSAKKGSLFEDFKPAVVPPKEIPDETDKKPSDWVDQKEIDDPTAKKPEDWDESQPKEIVDENDKKPEGWLDDGKEKIPDPKAEKPKDWDDEEDGKWEAPLIENEACKKIGCGEWKPRMIPNPKYKGKWVAPKIPNPAYKGEWKARLVPNPNYYEDKQPHALAKIGGVGIEIWTMTKNILFDNFIITHSKDVASEFAKSTWEVKNARELVKKQKEDEEAKKRNPSSDPLENFKTQVVDGLKKYWIPIVTVLLAIFISIPLLCCRGSSKSNDKEEDKKEKDKKEDKKEDKEDKKEEDKKKEDKKEDKEDKKDKKKDKKDKKEDKKEDKKDKKEEDSKEDEEENEEEDKKPKKKGKKGKKSNRL